MKLYILIDRAANYHVKWIYCKNTNINILDLLSNFLCSIILKKKQKNKNKLMRHKQYLVSMFSL